MYEDNSKPITPRPVFNTRISLRAMASAVLWTEHKQVEFEKKLGYNSGAYRIHTVSQLIREIFESFIFGVIDKYPQLDVATTEEAIRTLQSRGLRIPQSDMTRKSLRRALQDEYYRTENMKQSEPEAKAETTKPDKEEIEQQLKEFEERERAKMEELKKAQDSIFVKEEMNE